MIRIMTAIPRKSTLPLPGSVLEHPAILSMVMQPASDRVALVSRVPMPTVPIARDLQCELVVGVVASSADLEMAYQGADTTDHAWSARGWICRVRKGRSAGNVGLRTTFLTCARLHRGTPARWIGRVSRRGRARPAEHAENRMSADT